MNMDVVTILAGIFAMFSISNTLFIWVMNRIDDDVKALVATQHEANKRIDDLYTILINQTKKH